MATRRIPRPSATGLIGKRLVAARAVIARLIPSVRLRPRPIAGDVPGRWLAPARDIRTKTESTELHLDPAGVGTLQVAGVRPPFGGFAGVKVGEPYVRRAAACKLRVLRVTGLEGRDISKIHTPLAPGPLSAAVCFQTPARLFSPVALATSPLPSSSRSSGFGAYSSSRLHFLVIAAGDPCAPGHLSGTAVKLPVPDIDDTEARL